MFGRVVISECSWFFDIQPVVQRCRDYRSDGPDFDPLWPRYRTETPVDQSSAEPQILNSRTQPDLFELSTFERNSTHSPGASDSRVETPNKTAL